MSTSSTAPLVEQPAPRRMSMGRVVEMLLNRGGGEHSSVTLTRNAKGEVQIEVVVRTADEGEVTTADAAAEKAQAIFDGLIVTYPMSSGVTFNRGAGVTS